MTSRIAKQLFPDDDVRLADVREVTADGQYDLVIRNVPFSRKYGSRSFFGAGA